MQDMTQNTFDWIPIPAVIPTPYNENQNNPDISQTHIRNEIVPENAMDVDSFDTTTVTDMNV